MTDNTELQRLMRLRRLGRQIAASLPSDQLPLPINRAHALALLAFVVVVGIFVHSIVLLMVAD